MPTAYMFLAFLILLMYSVTTWMSSIENFENEEGITYDSPEEMFDETYASIYNALWHSNEKLKFEEVSFQDIALADMPVSSVKVLDMCCGTAPHACWFQELGVEYLGVDISDAMIKKAKKDCAKAKFQKGDVTQVSLFPQKSMTHCLLMNFSIYQFENPKILSDNVAQWLENGNLHLLDPLGYFDFQSLVKHADLILTDSGGIQEESTYRQVPCLTLRENTERPITVELGTNTLVPFGESVILGLIDEIHQGTYKKGEIPPLWDGKATERILAAISKILA